MASTTGVRASGRLTEKESVKAVSRLPTVGARVAPETAGAGWFKSPSATQRPMLARHA